MVAEENRGWESTCRILEHVLHLAGVLLVPRFMCRREFFLCAIVKIHYALLQLLWQRISRPPAGALPANAGVSCGCLVVQRAAGSC